MYDVEIIMGLILCIVLSQRISNSIFQLRLYVIRNVNNLFSRWMEYWKRRTSQRSKKQTPGNEDVWDGVEAVSHPEKADYHIALNRSSHHLDPSRTLIFSMEPPCFLPPDIMDGTSAAAKFPLLRSTRPQVWTLSGNLCKSYDELISQSPPQKSQNLSWITSDIGRRNSVIEALR